MWTEKKGREKKWESDQVQFRVREPPRTTWTGALGKSEVSIRRFQLGTARTVLCCADENKEKKARNKGALLIIRCRR